MQVSTLKPGLLVSLKTSIVGNAAYKRVEIEPDHLTEEGSRRARWETERVITDPVEREKARSVRGKCRSMVSRICTLSSFFGLLCPEDKQAALDEAIKEAQKLTAEFNNTAKLTRVGIYVIAGRIAADDAQAIRGINAEVTLLLKTMQKGIRELDPKVIREAANKAKSIGRMLSPEAAERIKKAVGDSREVAKSIAKAVKAGEAAALVIDHAVMRRISESRTMFLDIEQGEEIATPVANARALDLEPDTKPATTSKKKPPQPQLEV